MGKERGSEATKQRTEMEMTADHDQIPVYEGKPPKKLVPFEIEELDRANVRRWKNKIKTFLKLQRCWDAVELTHKWKEQPNMIGRLLQNRGWEAADAAARLYMLRGVKKGDEASILELQTSGSMWAWLMEKYERRTQADAMNAILKVVHWKMDPKMELEEALQQLERLNADLVDISDGKRSFDELTIITLFLSGLPQGYDAMKYSLLASDKLTRGSVLSRLQLHDSMV